MSPVDANVTLTPLYVVGAINRPEHKLLSKVLVGVGVGVVVFVGVDVSVGVGVGVGQLTILEPPNTLNRLLNTPTYSALPGGVKFNL